MKKAESIAAFCGLATTLGGLGKQIEHAASKLSKKLTQESADAQYAKIVKKKGIIARPRIPSDEFRHLMFCNSDVKDIDGLQVIVFEGRWVQLQKCTDDKITPNDVWYNPATFEISIMDETEAGTESHPNNLGGYKLMF